MRDPVYEAWLLPPWAARPRPETLKCPLRSRRSVPVITVSHRELDRLVGKGLSEQEVEDLAFRLAGEVEGIEGDAIALKWEPVRPDLFSVEGFARACRGL